MKKRNLDKTIYKYTGSTALIISAANNHTACADILLRAGASKDQKDEDGMKISLIYPFSL